MNRLTHWTAVVKWFDWLLAHVAVDSGFPLAVLGYVFGSHPREIHQRDYSQLIYPERSRGLGTGYNGGWLAGSRGKVCWDAGCRKRSLVWVLWKEGNLRSKSLLEKKWKWNTKEEVQRGGITRKGAVELSWIKMEVLRWTTSWFFFFHNLVLPTALSSCFCTPPVAPSVPTCSLARLSVFMAGLQSARLFGTAGGWDQGLHCVLAWQAMLPPTANPLGFCHSGLFFPDWVQLPSTELMVQHYPPSSRELALVSSTAYISNGLRRACGAEATNMSFHTWQAKTCFYQSFLAFCFLCGGGEV